MHLDSLPAAGGRPAVSGRPPVRGPLRAFAILATLLLLVSIDASAKKRDDVVEFGASRLVGEVKRVDRGKLYFKTDTTDTIALDWADIERLRSKQYLRLIDRDGRRYYGSLVATDTPAHLAVESKDGRRELPFEDIVSVEPIEATVWDRLDVDASAGYSYTKSNQVEEWSVGLDVDYETEDRSRALNVDLQSSDSEGEDGVVRNVLAYQTLKLRQDHWSSGWLSRLESNDALALDYRATFGFGVGPTFYPRANQRFRILFGVGPSFEKFEGDDSQSSIESFVATTVDWYRFSEPELDLSSTLRVIPSVTEFGRVRAGLDVSLKWEIFEDFYWELSLYDDYDNEAESDQANDNASSNDYGISTGIGWSY